MKLSDITAWLASNRDFKQGAALYAALGTNKTYVRLFALGATPYSQQVLGRELQALVGEEKLEIASPSPEPPPEPPAAAVPTPAPEPPKASLAAAPVPAARAEQALADVSQQLRAVRDERSHLHPQLTAKNIGKKARGPLALRIVALTAEETRLKVLKAHVLQHGRLPGPVATAELSDAGELRQRLLNLRSRRSKLVGKPEKADKLAAVQAEIDLIQSKLKA